MLRAVALALGGRAGARLAGRLAAGVSRMTLIRLIRALPDPAVSAAPRVLGVDEFALRRGHRYGTLLVDVETRRPVDILPERSADSFAAWLAARPGTEVICRDRAGCYADGGARGAPEAVQVADRWHLWHNLGEAVERAVARHRAAPGRSGRQRSPGERPPAASAASPAGPPAGRAAGGSPTGPGQRHADVHRLLAEGRSLSRDRRRARPVPQHRPPVRPRRQTPRSCSSTTAPASRPSILDEHEPYLRERWNSGCTNAAQLWREIRARGYRGGYTLRPRLPRPLPRNHRRRPPRLPARRRPAHVTGWIMTRPGRARPHADQASLDAILAACPELAAVTATSAPSPAS